MSANEAAVVLDMENLVHQVGPALIEASDLDKVDEVDEVLDKHRKESCQAEELAWHPQVRDARTAAYAHHSTVERRFVAFFFSALQISGNIMCNRRCGVLRIFDHLRHWTLLAFDTFGTYYVSAKGRRGEDGVVRMDGRDDDTMGPQVFTFVVEFVSDDELVVATDFSELAGQAFDEPFRMVTVRYRRK